MPFSRVLRDVRTLDGDGLVENSEENRRCFKLTLFFRLYLVFHLVCCSLAMLLQIPRQWLRVDFGLQLSIAASSDYIPIRTCIIVNRYDGEQTKTST